MLVVLAASYVFIAIIDLNMFTNIDDKRKLVLYITLMVISCAIGIACFFVSHMPSPANFIEKLVKAVISS